MRTPERHIVFIVQRAFSEHDVKRNRVHELLNLNCRVTVIDAGNIVFPGLDHDRVNYAALNEIRHFNAVVLEDLSELKRTSPLLNDVDLAVLYAGSGFVRQEIYRILRWLSLSPAPYAVISNNAQPAWDISLRKATLAYRFRNATPITSVLSRLPLAAIGLRPANYAVYGGSKSAIPMPLVDKNTKAVWATSWDYEAYQDEIKNQEPFVTDSTAVFIDQNFGFHSDAYVHDGKQPADPSYFYPRIRRLFDRIEHELGLSVIIAPHPRADYTGHEDLFGNRPMYPGNIVTQVRKSKLVICSYSTAINYAVLFRKPAFVYSLLSINKHPRVRNIPELMAVAIGEEVNFIDDPDSPSLTNVLTYDEQAYDDYTEKYIISAKSNTAGFANAIIKLCDNVTALGK